MKNINKNIQLNGNLWIDDIEENESNSERVMCTKNVECLIGVS